jgi:Uma2 family endonuclease
MTVILLEDEIHYPESDGKPVAESEFHLEEMIYVWQALKDRFRDEPDVFVGANLFLYYRRGDPSAVVAPDGFVVKGVPKLLPGNQRRRKYLLWEEGQVPCFVLETTSESTRDEDEEKKAIYEQLGVDEHFQFDPLGEYLSPRLQGFRRMGGKYHPLRPKSDGSLLSQTTGVIFRPDGFQLRLTAVVPRVPLLRTEEVRRARRLAEENAAVEATARQQAEDKVRALEEELARLRHSMQS